MTPEELGEKIRNARQASELTQSELARKVGWEQRVISELETGNRKLGAIELITIAEALELPPAYFLPNLTDDVSNLEAVMIEEMRLLPDDAVRWMIINIVRIIRKSLVKDSQTA